MICRIASIGIGRTFASRISGDGVIFYTLD